MYIDTKKKLDKLRYKHGEVKFRMAISHLMDVGIRHLTDELIEACCEEIMREDDSRSFMTNEYKCALVRLAGEIATVPHTELLVYIQRGISYDVGDGVFLPELPEKINSYVEYIEGMAESSTIYDDLQASGFSDEEIEFIGLGYVVPEENEDDE